jgi:hypothetical protein
MKLYGFSVKDMDEAACIAALMKIYQRIMKNRRIMAIDNKEKDGLLLQAYKDTLQPAGKVVGRTVQVLFAPIRAFLWGFEKIEQVVNEGLERRLAKIPDEKITTPAPEIVVPILQALMYSGENEILREMYLNLLATSVNMDREKCAHRS